MTVEPHEIVVTRPAANTISEELPEAVATAVIELITGALLENPQRVGVPLRNELEGLWSARRGTYRILYRINDSGREVVILRIAHRRDAYRSSRAPRPLVFADTRHSHLRPVVREAN